jgi:hypothetical protein
MSGSEGRERQQCRPLTRPNFSLFYARLGLLSLIALANNLPTFSGYMSRMKLADIGGVIARPTSLPCVADTQHPTAFVSDSSSMRNDPFIAAYITTRTLGMLFPFRNNFTTRFR